MTAFVGGLGQFFTPTNLLAIVALGLLAGQRVQRFPAVVMAVFAIGLLAGSLIVASAIRGNPAALGLLALAALAAGLVAAALPLPGWIASIPALPVGAAVALNSPPQELTIAGAVAAQIGTSVAAIVTLALVVFIAMNANAPWQRFGVRIVGSWIAASAVMALALKLTR